MRPERTNGKWNGRARRLACGLLALAFSPLLAQEALAASAQIAPAGLTRYANTRKVLYQPGMGLYFVFYQDGDGHLSYASFNGSNVVSSGTVISTNTFDTGGVDGPVWGSIWHVENSSWVYIAVPDGGTNDSCSSNCTTGNDGDPNRDRFYAIRGSLLEDGAIDFSAVTLKSWEVGINNFNNDWGDHVSQQAGGIAYIPDPGGASVAIAYGGQRDSSGNTQRGMIGRYNLSAALAAGSPFAQGDGSADSPVPSQVNATVVPVNDAGTWKPLFCFRDGAAVDSPRIKCGDTADLNTGTGADSPEVQLMYICTDSVGACGTGTTAELAAEGFGWSVTVSTDYTRVHLAYVDNNGDLYYARREGNNNWPQTAVPIDTNGTRAAPIRNPTIAYVADPNSFNRIYVIYEDPAGGLNYAVFPATATAAAPNVTLDVFSTAGAYPSVPNFIIAPRALPVVYEGSGGDVVMDFLITSSYPDPIVTKVEEVPSKAWFTQKTFTLKITGSNFRRIEGIPPSVTLLKNGASQDEISLGAATFYTSSITVPITLLSPTTSYDVQVTNPDQKTGVFPDTVTIPTPSFTRFYEAPGEPAAGPPNSGGIFPDNDGTLTLTRDFRVEGANFQNWGADGTASVYIDDGVTVSTVTDITTGNFTVKLKIAQSVTAGDYQVKVVNADGQEYIMAPTTFTVTRPLSAITYPLSGFTTGFASIKGTAGLDVTGDGLDDNPVTGIALADTQVRIECTAGCGIYNGFVWANDQWTDPIAINDEDEWTTVTGQT
ncbi:MAG TPA: hypothetical protein PKK31_08975, partial [Elusimicrobiales bacterium]|nr:hypothetical protein [Elusimicrobiales bacterium]